jgi:hypothetical protein
LPSGWYLFLKMQWRQATYGPELKRLKESSRVATFSMPVIPVCRRRFNIVCHFSGSLFNSLRHGNESWTALRSENRFNVLVLKQIFNLVSNITVSDCPEWNQTCYRESWFDSALAMIIDRKSMTHWIFLAESERLRGDLSDRAFSFRRHHSLVLTVNQWVFSAHNRFMAAYVDQLWHTDICSLKPEKDVSSAF